MNDPVSKAVCVGLLALLALSFYFLHQSTQKIRFLDQAAGEALTILKQDQRRRRRVDEHDDEPPPLVQQADDDSSQGSGSLGDQDDVDDVDEGVQIVQKKKGGARKRA